MPEQFEFPNLEPKLTPNHVPELTRLMESELFVLPKIEHGDDGILTIVIYDKGVVTKAKVDSYTLKVSLVEDESRDVMGGPSQHAVDSSVRTLDNLHKDRMDIISRCLGETLNDSVIDTEED